MTRLLRILSAVSALLLSVLPPVAAQHGRTDRIIIHRTNPEGMDSSLSSRNAGAASVAFDTSGIYTWSYPAADSLTLVRKGNFAIPCAGGPHMTVFFDPGTSDFYWYDIYSHDGGRIIRHNLISKATDTVITDIRAVINPNSMNIVSEDSIFLLNSNIQRIFLIDSSGETRKTLPLHSSATIFPGGSGQPYLDGGNLYYVVSDYRRLYSTYCLYPGPFPRKTRQEALVPYPGLYKDYTGYGYMLMSNPYSAYDPDRGQIVVGYPPDGHIYVFSLQDHSLRKYTVESRDAAPVEPFTAGKWRLDIEHFRSQTTYANILYDCWRDLYYRIVERSTPMPGVEMSERAKRLSVIIMDTDFRILGESEIAEDIHACFRYTCFVSEEGLNIQLLDPDTDRMTFATYATTVKHHRQ